VSNFNNAEKSLVKSIVATLSIKRTPDNKIIQEIYRQTNKTVSRMTKCSTRMAYHFKNLWVLQLMYQPLRDVHLLIPALNRVRIFLNIEIASDFVHIME